MSRFNIFGLAEQALYLRDKRQAILANNIANQDTPNFKARDIDFQKALEARISGKKGVGLDLTNERHIYAQDAVGDDYLLYRQPTQPSLDGNTVEGDVEKAQFMDNSIRYQATLAFLDSRIKTLKSAIKGQ